MGGIALLLILAGSITDVAVTMFWDRNAMLTSVLADVLVLLVGVAVINEWLDIRSAERWRTVAYYALVELLEASRDTWIRLSHELDVAQGEPMTVMQLSDRVLAEGGAAMLRDRAAAALADPEARARLIEIVAEISEETRTALTNWAPIMITTAPSADAINRFTHLHGRLVRLRYVLQEDIQGHTIDNIEVGDDEWAARRIATVIRLGAQLAIGYREESFRSSRRRNGRDRGVCP